MAYDVTAAPFVDIYRLYLAKIERKGRTEAALRAALCWVTGLTDKSLQELLDEGVSVRDFFATAPMPEEATELITGTVCGVKLAEVTDPLMLDI
ncbi:DUF2200 family protein [Corynebacterium choanae]|uniref:Uncharacterized protein n=1 Tax=Corynebacterium choanae TaxID=1862358 RepID=A0A3G6JA99_9CORY|nr:DUF2200 family protein [Corynebacterium choanae]AZA14723.1 hypothetical protein CCHOA_11760 [Corynebacterium choanae]